MSRMSHLFTFKDKLFQFRLKISNESHSFISLGRLLYSCVLLNMLFLLPWLILSVGKLSLLLFLKWCLKVRFVKDIYVCGLVNFFFLMLFFVWCPGQNKRIASLF
jgi:hypothetical protein